MLIVIQNNQTRTFNGLQATPGETLLHFLFNNIYPAATDGGQSQITRLCPLFPHLFPDGPDNVRNGIALTGIVHRLFDRGLISFDDQHNALLSSAGIPDELDKLIPAHKQLILPLHLERRAHSAYLRRHRENRFKC